MVVDQGLSDALQRAEAACGETAASLAAAEIPAEHLASVLTPKRVLLWQRPDTMRPLGRVWRVGPLLLGTDGLLFAAGRATRAAERGRPGYQSVSREERKELAAAALRGGYAPGDPVNFDARQVPLDPRNAEVGALLADPTLPLGYAEGEIRVRWRPGAPLAGAPTLAAFLAERAELLRHPLPE